MVATAGASMINSRAVDQPELFDVFILMASPLMRRLLRVAFVLVVARVLGPDEFGVYALLFAVVELLAVASGVGYAEFLTRETAKDERVGWGLASQLTFLRIAIAVLGGALVILILLILRYPARCLQGLH